MSEPKKEEKKTESNVKVPSRILLVGLGGMGLNALTRMENYSEEYADRVAIDTDGAALKASNAPRSLQFGAHLTDGMSTGGDVELGRRSANADFVKFREIFYGMELVILLTGLGGGVGSGAAPAIAQTARDEGALVISVATLPFPFEGDERARIAEKSLDLLRRSSHAVITMPNQYLLEDIGTDETMDDAFRRADEQMGAGFRVVWRLLAQHNLINLDFNSLKHMLESAGGVCTLVHAEAAGKNKAQLALNRVMKHPAVKNDNVLNDANGLLVGLLGGAEMTLLEVQEIMHGISNAVHSNARRFMGAGIDPSMKNRLSLMLLVGGKAEEAKPEAAPIPRKPEPAPADRKKPKAEQKELILQPTSKGRFKDVEPTIYEGEDLDLPTFIRRGMKLTR